MQSQSQSHARLQAGTHLKPTPSSAPSRSHPVIRFQQTLGNQAVQALVQSGMIQPKLALHAPANERERDADRMAARALSPSFGSSGPDGHCAECRTKGQGQRSKADGIEFSSIPPVVREALMSPGQPLDGETRSFMESRFNYDFGEIRLHTDSAAVESARSINALAYTTANRIVFGAGQFAPGTSAGRRLLAHELAHVALGHSGIQRRTDMEAEMRAEAAERRRQEAEERQRHHEAWSGSVGQQFTRDLGNQPATISGERERIGFALTAQRAAVFDAVANGQGWLTEALKNQSYTGPGLSELKPLWSEALVAAETLKLSASSGTVGTDAQLLGLEAIPAFFNALGVFARAAEEAHRTHVATENARLSAAYDKELAEYGRHEQLDRMAQGPIGEPGERAFRAGQAIARGPAPRSPAFLTAPAAISGQVDAANANVYRAETAAQWSAVASDVQRLGNGAANLVVASLPASSEVRTGLEYLQQLETRLAQFEESNAVTMRIPAVFYPKDRTVNRRGENGQTQLAAQAIPWQFYLINTGVASRDQPARAGGEWVLVDLTSSQRFENRTAATPFDSARLQMGETVNPPVSMFSALNSRIRFPEGRLYFTLPSGTSYVLETTEPWSLSDWLSAIGIALAAITITASVLATGGASTPAAVAFYAGLGAAAAGAGSTLAQMHEKSEQGILTSADVNNAMVSIGIDIITAASMGLGRLVSLPATAARIGLTGERFIALQRITQVVRAGAIGADVYQAYSLTSGLIAAFNAIERLPEEERSRMRSQLVRTALLSGALLVVAIRGDVRDFQAGRALRVSHVDPDGALVVAHSGASPAHPDTPAPHERADAPGVSAGAHATPHPQATGPAHANSERAGAGLAIGAESHAVGAAGSGPGRDFYFCSGHCNPIVMRLGAILDVIPPSHPEHEIYKELRNRARTASRRLKQGELTQEEADAIARQISGDVARHSRQSELFAALMNTDPALLAAHRGDIRRRLSRALDIQETQLRTQREGQAANRGAGRGRDPLAEPDPRSPLETDLLGGLDIQAVDRAGRRLQPLHFDVGNFSHTHAEALVPNLPRGLNKEVPVTLPDGTAGRADRVRFILDADGDRIGAHVFEVKPNVGDNVTRGQQQVQGYVAGLRAEIEATLRAKGKAVPTAAPGGGPLYTGTVLPYNYEQMVAVLRALRASRRDAARLAEYEAIARQVFGGVN